jgi:hypothetical protein
MFKEVSLLKVIGDTVYKAAIVISLGSGATLGFLYDRYFDFPRTPDHRLGRIVPYEVKGFVVYLTPAQHETMHWLTWVLAVSMAVALVGRFVAGPPKRWSTSPKWQG